MSTAFPNTMAMRFIPSSNTPTLTSDVRIASAAAIASCGCMLFMNASIACLSPVFNACVCIFMTEVPIDRLCVPVQMQLYSFSTDTPICGESPE